MTLIFTLENFILTLFSWLCGQLFLHYMGIPAQIDGMVFAFACSWYFMAWLQSKTPPIV